MKILIKCIIYISFILLFAGCSQADRKFNIPTKGETASTSLSPSDNSSSEYRDKITLQTFELLRAIKKGDKKKVKEIVKEHPECINIRGSLEYNLEIKNGYIHFKSRQAAPLLAAILTGKNDIAYMLIKSGADIRETGEVEYSSKIDGAITSSGPEIWSPLFAAVHTGDTQIAKMLIEKGANMNIRGNVGRSLLHLAVNKGQPEMTALLLEKGADVNACDSYGSTPIASALTTSPEIMEILQKAGAKGVERLPSNEADEFLSAIVDGNMEKVKMMTEKNKEKINLRGSFIYTINRGSKTKSYKSDNSIPLLAAAITGEAEIVKYLIEKGALTDRRSQITYAMTDGDKSENFSSYDWTPLMGAVSAENADIVKLLLSAGANIDATNSRGFSPLIIAIRNRNAVIVEILLSAGADYYARDASGSFVMEHAKKTEDILIIDLLKKHIKKNQKKPV